MYIDQVCILHEIVRDVCLQLDTWGSKEIIERLFEYVAGKGMNHNLLSLERFTVTVTATAAVTPGHGHSHARSRILIRVRWPEAPGDFMPVPS